MGARNGLARKIIQITKLLITSNSRLSGWKNRFCFVFVVFILSVFHLSHKKDNPMCLRLLVSLETCGHKDLCGLLLTSVDHVCVWCLGDWKKALSHLELE